MIDKASIDNSPNKISTYKNYDFEHYLNMAEKDAEHYEREERFSAIIMMLFIKLGLILQIKLLLL